MGIRCQKKRLFQRGLFVATVLSGAAYILLNQRKEIFSSSLMFAETISKNFLDSTNITAGKALVHKHGVSISRLQSAKAKNEMYETDEIQGKTTLAATKGKSIYLTIATAGRLGNQMFEYAALIGLARQAQRNGRNVVPFVATNSPLRNLWDVFELKEAVILRIKSTIVLSEEKPMAYSPNILPGINPGYNYTLHKYFQSWKYFQTFSDEIRHEFQFKQRIKEQARNFLKKAIGKQNKNITLVGVHVRVGDMASISAKKRGYNPANRTYLHRAMSYYREMYGNVLFVVCSDDIPWSVRNVHGKDVLFSKNHQPDVDMAILSMCNHTVITSGTFGWWAGWLAGGTVVYFKQFPLPGTWLDSMCVQEDYYVNSWIGL